MNTSDEKSVNEKFYLKDGEKCPECKENAVKTEVVEWGGLTQYIYKYCLNCGFQEKVIKSLY